MKTKIFRNIFAAAIAATLPTGALEPLGLEPE